MATDRVQSKNLFNFKLQGFLDEDITAFDEKMKSEHNIDMEAMKETMKNQTEEEFVGGLRAIMDGVKDIYGFYKGTQVVEAHNSCDNTELSVATGHDGEYSVKVLVHTPKFLASQTNRPCIVYAHGGGVVGGSAETYSRYLAYMALDCGVVVFNVDYRLAPETRCPNNVLDFYSALKHVTSHASELGVDPARIAIAGESGGGYICAGAMVELAKRGESGLVKLAIPIIPMLDDYEFSTSKESMTKHEAESRDMMQRIWKAIGGPDFEAKRAASDPLLFPGKASDSLLAAMPPTIVWEEEFDMYITPATRFAGKLRAAGRLLELVVIPGAKHGSGMMPDFKVWKLEREAWRMAIQEYLVR